MSSKNLTFKLVIDADTKDFVSNVQQSEKTAKALFDAIKIESDKLKTASEETAKEVGKIVPDDLQKKADQAKGKLGGVSQAAGELQGQAVQAAEKIDGLGNGLQDTANKANKAGFEIGGAIPGDAVQLAEMLGNKFFSAAKEIESLGDKSTISAGELRAMSSVGEQGLNELNLALKAAQAELVRLQSTDGTLQDIEIAKQRVLSIQDAINEASSAFNYYQGVAINAMKGVDGATQSAINQIQRFSAVDLTGVVGEAQTATRAIESMGDGASLSTKEIERIGSIGTNSINALERELQQANTELRALNNSSDAISLEKFNEATLKVNSLEDALGITKTAFTEFNTKASSAMQNVTTSTDKASGSAKQAGHAIYEALGIKPPSVINDAIADLTRKLENFKANSKLPAEEVERVTKITEQQIEKLKSELNGVEPAAQKANSGVSVFSRGMDGAKFAVTALVGALATIGVGLGLRELAQAADSYTNLSARINIATSDGGNFQQAMAGVHQVALMTNSSLDATAGLFTKVNDVGKQMGMTQQQSLDLVKTINMAIQTGGGSAQASEAAIVQLTQALQSGVLRGDEFNSIMEQAPGISKALAQSLGVTTGELRAMAGEGQLSAEKVIKALQDQSAAIEADYAKFPTTIGNALQKISTQWQILIGEMDQANGSSATVAKALSTIADNLGILKLFFDDAAEGVGYFTSKFDDIDPSTLNALRDTLTQVYENIKLNIKYVADFGETAWSAFTSALDAISPLFNALIGGGEDVSGFTTFLNMLRMAMAAVSDASFGLNVGLKILLSSVQFLAGGVYSLAAATLKYVPFMGDLADEAEKASDRMFAQAEKNLQGAIQLSTEHKWAVVETYEDIRKTQKEKNEEAVADSTATFADLVKQNQEFSQKSKDLADERAAIDAQLNQARKGGNQSTIDAIIQKSNELEGREKEHAANKAALDKDMLASAQDYAEAAIKANGGVMDGVMQADLLTKGYIATIDEAGKVSVQAGQSAEQAAESAAKKEEALRLAKENVKKADEEYLAYQKQAAVERALLEQQIEQAKKTGDLNALASAQASINTINTKEAELANNRDLRIAELNKANTGSGQVAETAYSRAAAAAKLFGVDLDVSLNKVSKSFSSSGNELDGLKIKLDEAGYTGKQAGDVLYQAWEDWLSKAKSQAEIDMAKAKLQEFGDQGKVSTAQVEQGLIAIKMQAQKLPDDIDPVTESFKRLGIETKENLKLAAQQALMDFINVRDSGKATAEGVQKAYEKAAQSAAASGDAGRIAAVNAMNAGRNLEVQIDETGKATVKATDKANESLDSMRRSTDRVRDGVKGIEGSVHSATRAIDGAKSSTEEWADAVNKAKGEFDKAMKQQSKSLGSLDNYDSYNKNDVISMLKSQGYDDKDAKKLAGNIWSQAMEADRDAKMASYGNSGVGGLDTLMRQMYDDAAKKGITTQHGTNKINELMRSINVASTGSSNLNDYAPSIPSVPSTRDYDKGGDNVNYTIVVGNQKLGLTGKAEDKPIMDQLINLLKTQAKST